METRWLEDFLVLAETGSFTRSAELRHLTQPAFSRRIKALENWLGADLIDRTTWPTRLTPAGELLQEKARLLVGELSSTRSLLRGLQQADAATLTLAVPPTFWVGDAAVTSWGNCASSSFNSRVRASYSKSSNSGAS